MIHRRRRRNTCSLLSLLIKKNVQGRTLLYQKDYWEEYCRFRSIQRESFSDYCTRLFFTRHFRIVFFGSRVTRMLQMMLQRWCVTKVIKRYCIALSHSDTRQVKRCKWCSRFTQQGIRVCCKWWWPWYHRGTPPCSGWSPFLRRGRTVNHIDDPPSVARSSTHLWCTFPNPLCSILELLCPFAFDCLLYRPYKGLVVGAFEIRYTPRGTLSLWLMRCTHDLIRGLDFQGLGLPGGREALERSYPAVYTCVLLSQE